MRSSWAEEVLAEYTWEEVGLPWCFPSSSISYIFKIFSGHCISIFIYLFLFLQALEGTPLHP